MKEETNEIRVKLHISSTNDPNVRNLWMCLNYNQKPTIAHLIDHIKKNYCLNELSKEYSNKKVKSLDSYDNGLEELEEKVKLFLEDYWLPPCENSRLIREGDCIKVEIKTDLECHNDNINKYFNSKKINKNSYASNDDYYASKNILFDSNTSNDNEQDYYNYNYDYDYDYNYDQESNYYNNYKNNSNLIENKKDTKNSQNKNQKINNLNSNVNKTNKSEKSDEIKKSKSLESNKSKSENNKNKQSNASNKQTTKNKTNCYKKFAVGSLLNMLKEEEANKLNNQNSKPENVDNEEDSDDLSEEQIIDDYYQSIQQKKNTKVTKKIDQTKENDKKQYINESVNLDKIASNINTNGKAKWKNNVKPVTSNGPKHIRFPSTSESDSSSDSSSSSSESEEEEEKKNKNSIQNTNKQSTTENKNTNKNYYEPTKEEQLNSNPKSLADFKKVFNQTKLNAPAAEEFTSKQNEVSNLKQQECDDKLNTSTSSVSSNTDNESKTNKGDRYRKRRSPSPMIDYDKYEPLVGAPRLNDRIAFQILEISSNFTPEISKFKNGTVVEFDSTTNEITLKLNSRYKTVLQRPSKFSVILDETEEENDKLKNDNVNNEELNESTCSNQSNSDNLIKVDWRNLINVKLMPDETPNQA